MVHNKRYGSMDPWIHGSAAGAGARAAAEAAGVAAASAAVCIYHIVIGGVGQSNPILCSVHVHDTIHTPAAEAAAPTAALAAAPATVPWSHGSIFFITKHIFYYEIKSRCMWFRRFSCARCVHSRSLIMATFLI